MFACGKATGYDNTSMRVIKHTFNLISAPLTNIINLSLQKGIFPDKLKLAKVIQIFQINTLDIAKFMFRLQNNLLPPLLLNLFITVKSIDDTRTAGNYRVRACPTIISRQFFTKDLGSGTDFLPLLPICQFLP